ncbi:hypothetical protein [Marinobacter sp. V034]|uniref:hypothetical protein n=1 Tax=Marinobacter sp. V034 TaxID=3459610 RepID=UPI004044DB8A
MKSMHLPIANCVLGLTLSGCSALQTAEPGTDDSCGALQQTIESYDTGFENLRGKASNFNALTLYRAKQEIVKGRCEIWAWANTDSAYVCSLKAPDDEVARKRFDTVSAQVSECLGPDWQSETFERDRSGDDAGYGIRFTQPGRDVVVSVHTVVITKGPSTKRSNDLYIGSPGRLANSAQ